MMRTKTHKDRVITESHSPSHQTEKGERERVRHSDIKRERERAERLKYRETYDLLTTLTVRLAVRVRISVLRSHRVRERERAQSELQRELRV